MRILGFEITRPRTYTALHPDFKTSIEFSFKAGGQDFYTFTNMLDMPTRRYQRMSEFIREAEMRMTRDELYEYIDIMEKSINAGNFTNVVSMIDTIKYSLELMIETETYYRLFSCAFFTLEEDLTDYDDDWGSKKVAIFKAEKPDDFFFTKPIKEYLPPLDISKDDLRVFLKQTEVKVKYISTLKSKILAKLEKAG